MIRRFLQEESGPTATEYAVMLSLIVMVSLTAVTVLGTTVSTMFIDITHAMFGN